LAAGSAERPEPDTEELAQERGHVVPLRRRSENT
jgi:hypothetical protein